jgi:hypothetical protein
VIEVGANIPLKSGFTTVTVAEGFEACEEEDVSRCPCCNT